MPISDNSPERRNLMLGSMAFIVYYSAGGHVVDNTLKLPVINIAFDKPHVVAGFAWAMLIWFGLRFWQKFGSSFVAGIQGEISGHPVPRKRGERLLKDNVEAEVIRVRGTSRPIQSFKLGHMKIGNRALLAEVIFEHKPGGITTHAFPLTGYDGFMIKLSFYLQHAIKGNAIAEFLVPYILLVTAVTGPLWSRLIS